MAVNTALQPNIYQDTNNISPDTALQAERLQIERVYEEWQEYVYTGKIPSYLGKLVSEVTPDSKAQDRLLSQLSGYISLIVLDFAQGSPLEAYNLAQAAVLGRAVAIKQRLTNTEVLDELIGVAVNSVKRDHAEAEVNIAEPIVLKDAQAGSGEHEGLKTKAGSHSEAHPNRYQQLAALLKRNGANDDIVRKLIPTLSEITIRVLLSNP